MNRIPIILLAVFGGCNRSTPQDSQLIIGEWVVVDFHSPKAEEDRGQRRKLAMITEGTWSQQFQGNTFEDFEYTLDPTKSPKEVDLTYTTVEGKRLTVRGIYEMPDSNRLLVCLGTAPIAMKDGKVVLVESVRPTVFDNSLGPMISYRRKTE